MDDGEILSGVDGWNGTDDVYSIHTCRYSEIFQRASPARSTHRVAPLYLGHHVNVSIQFRGLLEASSLKCGPRWPTFSAGPGASAA